MGRRRIPIDPVSARRLRVLLAAAGVKMNELAPKVGMSKTTLCNVARGVAAMTREKAEAIAEQFPGVSASWLMNEERVMAGSVTEIVSGMLDASGGVELSMGNAARVLGEVFGAEVIRHVDLLGDGGEGCVSFLVVREAKDDED